MEKKNKIALAFAGTVFYATCSMGQFSIDAQLRTRAELRDGYQKLAAEGSEPAAVIFQRSRIPVNYKADKLFIRVSPQYVNTWGGEEIVSGSGVASSSSLGIHESYAQIKAAEYLSVAVGRQELRYDNQRLLSARNWNNNGMSYDAAVLKIGSDSLRLHAGGVWNNIGEPTSGNLYPSRRIKNIGYLWGNIITEPGLTASLLHLSSAHTVSDTVSKLNTRHTSGLYFKYGSDILSFWGSSYLQYGKNAAGKEVIAGLLDAEASVTAGKLTTGAGYSYLSGNKGSAASRDKDNLFDILYGTRHGYAGGIDYFRSMGTDTKGGGLQNAYLFLSAKLTDKLNIKNTGHYFWLAQANDQTPSDKALGFENDLVIDYKFEKWGALQAGYSFFLPTESLEKVQNVPNSKFSQFAYLQLIISTNIFKN
jgi:hypothetical protein